MVRPIPRSSGRYCVQSTQRLGGSYSAVLRYAVPVALPPECSPRSCLSVKPAAPHNSLYALQQMTCPPDLPQG